MKLNRRRRKSLRQAFTLIEVLLVVMILAVIAGVVIRSVFASQDLAFESLARTQISSIQNQLKEYKLWMKSYPASLEALHKKPSDLAANVEWHQIMEEPVSADPWGNPYEYKVSGTSFEIRSGGKDGQMNTEDDITNNASKES